MTEKNDFSKGSIAGNILGLALPMTLAQLINVRCLMLKKPLLLTV